MTKDFAEKNLETQTEAYLKENILPNTSNSISVLHRCKSLLPIVEDINLVNRIINVITSNACKEQLTSGLILINYAHNSLQGLVAVRDPQLVKGGFLDLELQKKQRPIIEAIISLLPTQSRKSVVPMAFLSRLLKSAIAASASTPYRSDLERRIGL
ncbi:hypothetical protein CsSME_00047060 [Camellia sinensis var. sinensis]